MTEDTSPENLRKFLESDDPALVQMGLSMAKGSGVPDDLLGEILWMYMFHDDSATRAAAKSTFMKIAPNKSKEIIKNNWKANYRTLKGERFTEAIRPLIQESNDELDKIVWRLMEPIIEAVQIKPRSHKDEKQKNNAAKALGNFGDIRAVEPLIKALGDKETQYLGSWRALAAEALGKIGDARAVEPLIAVLGIQHTTDYGHWGHLRLIKSAIEALGKIGDTRAVEPLITVGHRMRSTEYLVFQKPPNHLFLPPVIESAKEALRKLGHEVE